MEKKVIFKNWNCNMAGCLFTPDDFDETKKYAGLVVCHPGGGVKEQTSAIYAQGMAKAGFVVLTFDASHQGESGGNPRLIDNPYERTEDIKCGVDYLTTLPYIDRARIGAVGSCAGAGYAIFATLTDRRIKAVCGICCTNPGASTRQGWLGTRSVAEQIKRLDEIAEQRTAEANGAEPKYIHYVPEADEIDENTPNDMIEAHDYYRNPERAMHPNSPNKFRFIMQANRMTFDAYEFIPDYLDRPLLVVAGSKAESLWQSKLAVELSNGPKELFVVEGAGHFDLYDNMLYINKVLAKMTTFFNDAFA
ncbi:MAG: alpha/beta hydrolase [Prevotellaceae bacterium]|nr:alpha/beta hydrolase [Prevotellaceae bacterium]